MSSCPIPALSAVTNNPVTTPSAVTEGEKAGPLHALSAVTDPRDPRGVRYPLGRAAHRRGLRRAGRGVVVRRDH